MQRRLDDLALLIRRVSGRVVPSRVEFFRACYNASSAPWHKKGFAFKKITRAWRVCGSFSPL